MRSFTQAKILSIDRAKGRIALSLKNGLTTTGTYLYDLKDLRAGMSVLVGKVDNSYVVLNRVENMPRDGASYSVAKPVNARYWVGGSGDWIDANHWSLSSNGVPGASIPSLDALAVIDEYSFSPSLAGQLLIFNYNGEHGSTNYIDEAQGMTIEKSVPAPVLSAIRKEFGISSLKMIPDSYLVTYFNQPLNGDFTYHGWVRIDNGYSWEILPNGTGRIDLLYLVGGSSRVSLTLLKGQSPGIDLNFHVDDQDGYEYNQTLTSFQYRSYFDKFAHIALVCHGKHIFVTVEGIIQFEFTSAVDNPLGGLNRAQQFSTEDFPSTVGIYFDSWELVNYAKWTGLFYITPTSPPLTGVINMPATLSVGSIHTSNSHLIEMSSSAGIWEISASGSVELHNVRVVGSHASGGNFSALRSNGNIDSAMNGKYSVSENTGWDFGNMYWIGNGGSFSDPLHWSHTSGGIPGAVPSYYDTWSGDSDSITLEKETCIFDSNSVTISPETHVNKLILNFEGTNGATTWIEEAQGLTPSEVYPPAVIDTSQYYSGSSSLKIYKTGVYGGYVTYNHGINFANSFKMTARFKYTLASDTFIFFNMFTATYFSSQSINISIYKSYGVLTCGTWSDCRESEYSFAAPITLDPAQWHLIEVIVDDRDLVIKINGIVFDSWTIQPRFIDYVANMDSLTILNASTSPVWIDSVTYETYGKQVISGGSYYTAAPQEYGTLDFSDIQQGIIFKPYRGFNLWINLILSPLVEMWHSYFTAKGNGVIDANGGHMRGDAGIYFEENSVYNIVSDLVIPRIDMDRNYITFSCNSVTLKGQPGGNGNGYETSYWGIYGTPHYFNMGTCDLIFEMIEKEDPYDVPFGDIEDYSRGCTYHRIIFRRETENDKIPEIYIGCWCRENRINYPTINTMEAFIVETPCMLRAEGRTGSTFYVNSFVFSGTIDKQAILDMGYGNPEWTIALSKPSGVVSLYYTDVRCSIATGGATWNALVSNGNFDDGDNVGWNF